MSADLFEDPGQTLLARGSADPFEQLRLTEAETDQLDAVREEANDARTLAHVGVALGAAFLLYAAYVSRRSREELSPQPESRFLQALTLRNARNFIPAWVYMVTPALETAYTIGAVRGGSRMAPDQMVTQFAQRYAVDIANYFNQTSAQALTEGFNTYVNRKMARRMAAEKVLGAFGLNSRMMRALVGRVARNKIDSPIEIDAEVSTRDWIEMMLVQRAHDIGDNEGFNVSQHGQQITWLYLQKTGRLSMAALKVWHTARDERVCPSCGPLDKQAVPINQPFATIFGKLWVPSMHPNCRCEVRLRSSVREEFNLNQDDYAVAKADFEEREHPRARDGRFRNKPSQRPVAEREAETDLERLLREVQISRQAPEEIDLGRGISLGSPTQEQISLGQGQVNLGQADINLNPVELSQQREVQLERPAVAIPASEVYLQGATSVDLQDTTKALIDLATEQDTISLAEKVKAPIPAAPGIIDLPNTLYRLDPAGFHYYEGVSEHLDLDEDTEVQHATFDPEHEFTNLAGVIDQTAVMYTREIKREVQRIMQSNRNYIREQGQQLDQALVLDPHYVELAITAEVLGTDDPQLRMWANNMGVHRHDWVTARYRMDRAYSNGFEGDLHAHGETEYYSAPGRYFAQEDMLPADGWPVIDYNVEPEEEEGQYDDFAYRDDLPHDRD